MNITAVKQAPDEEIHAQEGVTRGDSARVRMLFLVSQNNALLTQTQFADAKAGALMTLLLLISIRGTSPGVPTIQDPLELGAMAMVIVSIGFCLAAIMPRVLRHGADKLPAANNRYTWFSMAMPAYSTELHGEFSRQSDVGALLNSVASSNVGASRVLARKFAMLRWAFYSGFAACVLLLIATVT